MKNELSVSVKMLLSALAEGSFQYQGDKELRIKGVTWDYQKVVPGSLYFCVEEEEFQEAHIETTSLDYWKEAIQAGAVCLVAARGRIHDLPEDVALLEVDQVNTAMAFIAKAFYGDPLAGMKIIGITGTNGKTTTTQLLDSILIQAGQKTGVVGTIGTFFPSGREEASHLSNPMATELFEIGHRMHENGVQSLTMEVTSHAGAFDRNAAIDFDVAVFTNLTQDHLDYHKTIDSYKRCKLKHFERLGTQSKKAYGIVNVDDLSGAEFIDAVDKHLVRSGRVEILTYGIRNKDADLVAYPKEMTGSHSDFDLFLRGNHLCHIHLPMPGLFNIYNSVAAFGAAFAMGISIERIVEGLKNARRVDGRFERVACPADYEVYVDYAHTPDSLEKILKEIRGITRKRVIAVFGCGGDRDRSKRGLMGAIAAELADICVVTSDNPRSEDPKAIIDEILSGIPKTTRVQLLVEPDRRQAIFLALETASAEDSVLIAGKGHEDYQIIGKTRHKFLDRAVVQDFFRSNKQDYSRAWLEINLPQMAENLRLLMADKPDGLKVMAVVKDDALGHGIIKTAKEAIAAGCEYLGVACLSEALDLRKEFENAPILVFGERFDDEIAVCVRHNISVQIQSKEKAELIAAMALKQNKEIAVHLKVDTGMGRFGIRWDRAAEEYRRIRAIKGIRLDGIMTHFAQSDEAIKDHANLQWQRFQQVLTELESDKILPPFIHACNSGGYLDLPHAHGNLVRIGILPCGVYPSKVCRRITIDNRELQPVMSARARVAFIKTLQPGDTVGYGMHYQAESPRQIAVLPLGYGDGYPRLRNKGFVLIHGEEAPIIGGNGMDATMVDITDIPRVAVGDEVVLLGCQGQREITAMMLADWAGTVTYEILSGWSKRMERRYL